MQRRNREDVLGEFENIAPASAVGRLVQAGQPLAEVALFFDQPLPELLQRRRRPQ